jgi:signal transduction histidine kinase
MVGVSFVSIAIFYCANIYFFASLKKTGLQLNLPPEHIFFAFIRNQASTMNVIFLVTAIVAFAFIIFSGLFLSHRVAGPLHRLKKHMNDVIEGKSTKNVSFREKDFFLDVAETYNRQLEHLLKNKN